jgi:hypothetical protein
MTMISMHVGSADSDSIDADDNFVVAKWGLWLITPFEYIGLGINERLHEPLIARPVRLISPCRPHEADARICDSLIHTCNLEIDRWFEFLLSVARKIDGLFTFEDGGRHRSWLSENILYESNITILDRELCCSLSLTSCLPASISYATCSLFRAHQVFRAA